MNQNYSIGPLHFSLSFRFEWRTKRHDRIFRVVDAYCRQNLNMDQLGVVSPIIEWKLYPYFDCLHSRKELTAVLWELHRRGYGPGLYSDLIAPEELWEFFRWVRIHGAPFIDAQSGKNVVIAGCVLRDACDLHVEVYRWRYPGKLER